MASIFAQAETPGTDWKQIHGWLESAVCDDETEILAPDELLFVARQLTGNPPVGVAVGAATVGMGQHGADVILAGGENTAIMPLLDTICKWAGANGAKRIYAAGRRGWDRVSPFKCVGHDDGTYYYELEI